MSIKEVCLAVAILGFILLSVWAVNLYFTAGRLNNWLTLQQITDRVRADLTPGTPLSEIDKYFVKNNVEHSYYEPTNEVFAAIRFIWGGNFFTQKDASITIKLNEQKELKEIKVQSLFTGP